MDENLPDRCLERLLSEATLSYSNGPFHDDVSIWDARVIREIGDDLVYERQDEFGMLAFPGVGGEPIKIMKIVPFFDLVSILQILGDLLNRFRRPRNINDILQALLIQLRHIPSLRYIRLQQRLRILERGKSIGVIDHRLLLARLGLLLLDVLLEHLSVVVHVGGAGHGEVGVVFGVLPVEIHPLILLLYLHQIAFILVHLLQIVIVLIALGAVECNISINWLPQHRIIIETTRLPIDVAFRVDECGYILVVRVEMAHHVDGGHVLVLEAHGGQNLVALLLHHFVITKQLNQHFLILGLEHGDCD